MKQKIKSLQIIHLALCTGVIIAYVIMNKLSSLRDIFNISIDTNEDYIYLLIPVFAFVLSNFIYKQQLKTTGKNSSLDFNFNIFQSASIMRWAVLEGSAFIILILKPELIISGIVIIVYLFLLRPTEERFKNDVNLI